MQNSASFIDMVPRVGLEPTHLAAGDFESPASTNFATWAVKGELYWVLLFCKPFFRSGCLLPPIDAHNIT